MKNTLSLILIALIFGCKSEIKQRKIDWATLNLIVKTDKIIDSVWVSDFGQTESFFLPFTDTIKINFTKELSDLYNIYFYTKNGRLSNQFWLDGTNVVLIGELNKKLEIDTVLNSDLYYSSINFSKGFQELTKKKSDSITIDNFLLKNIRKNIGNPFSFAVAGPYISRNQNNKDKIRKLFNVLENQNDSLKGHIISIHGRIESILNVASINLSNYKFDNIENELTSIELGKPKTYLLDFWFINCPPCIRDHKLIAKKLDFLKKKNIELIGISTDRSHSDWKNYLTNHNYNWKNYREIDSLKRITQDMAIWSFPTYILLNREGAIKARFNSFEDFEKHVNK